jgi:flavodoxin
MKKIAIIYGSASNGVQKKALEVLTTALTGDTLTVTVAECPGVKHLRKTGREVSAWYGCTTEMVMQTIADRCGLVFTMLRYDEETGAAEYRFEKR